MEVTGQPHTPAMLPLMKEPAIPIEYEADPDVLEKS
jgi:hypothetical protein